VTRALLIAVLALLSACMSTPSAFAPVTVPAVDLNRYAGRWYEIARYPNRFQDGSRGICEGTTATYSLRADGQVSVVNRCVAKTNEGQVERVANGVAYALPNSGNARLRVSFFWPFYGDYWVIGLDPDYRWAVVGSPGRDYLWILSRESVMPAGAYLQALEIARRAGFDTAKLQVSPQ
jgi:apolipoprotein D and lipocalin family protein